MGQEYWVRFKNKKKVNDYLQARGFPKDRNFPKTLIIASEATKTDCWLTWKGTKLKIASQVFVDQSAWCAAIADRLIEMFQCERVGADSTGWWKKGEIIGKPFSISIEGLRDDARFEKDVKNYKIEQKLFIKEAKRLLPQEEKCT